MWAKMTAMYDRSSAGAVMLNTATIVCVDPIPIRFKDMQQSTTSQTPFMGVCVLLLILLQKLSRPVCSVFIGWDGIWLV